MPPFALLALLALTVDGKLDDSFWKSIAPQSFTPAGGEHIQAVGRGPVSLRGSRTPGAKRTH